MFLLCAAGKYEPPPGRKLHGRAAFFRKSQGIAENLNLPALAYTLPADIISNNNHMKKETEREENVHEFEKKIGHSVSRGYRGA